MDALYEGWGGLPRVAEQLDDLLRPLASGEPGRYRRYDWHAGAYAETVDRADDPAARARGRRVVVAVVRRPGDGAGVARRAADVRMARAVARDGAAMAEHLQQWAIDEAGALRAYRHPGPRGRHGRRTPRVVTMQSGEQFQIEGGGYRAVVTESGGALRVLEHDGRPLIDGFGDDEVAPGGRGQLLAPWPNRIRDGAYSFAGRDFQLALTEPSLQQRLARSGAVGGLVAGGAHRALGLADLPADGAERLPLDARPAGRLRPLRRRADRDPVGHQPHRRARRRTRAERTRTSRSAPARSTAGS